MILAHWTYSKQEWNSFMRSGKKQKGILYYLRRLINSGLNKRIPEIKITGELVSIGRNLEYFSSSRHALTDIHIREEGVINIIEIGYECTNQNFPKRKEIIIPVPRGKLREAFEVEERLLSAAALCQ